MPQSSLRDPVAIARIAEWFNSSEPREPASMTALLAGFDDTKLENAIEDAVVIAHGELRHGRDIEAHAWFAVAGFGLALLDVREAERLGGTDVVAGLVAGVGAELPNPAS